jgi:HSP20 family protein
MPGLIVWKNQEIDRLRRDMDRLLARFWDDFGVPFFPRATREAFALELSETEDTLFFRAEVPGIDPDDLEVIVTDNKLTIKGELRQDLQTEGEDYEGQERRYGFFSRSIQLPCKVLMDEVKASYKDGVLSIVLPKCKQESARGVKIKIT